jgi:hypothetical protein
VHGRHSAAEQTTHSAEESHHLNGLPAHGARRGGAGLLVQLGAHPAHSIMLSAQQNPGRICPLTQCYGCMASWQHTDAHAASKCFDSLAESGNNLTYSRMRLWSVQQAYRKPHELGAQGMAWLA